MSLKEKKSGFKNGVNGKVEKDKYFGIEMTDVIAMFIADAAGHELLTADEEIQLAKRVRKGRIATSKLGVKGSFSIKQREDLESLLLSVEEGENRMQKCKVDLLRGVLDGLKAQDDLAKSNIRLVVDIAQRYAATSNCELAVLIQEGNIGLLKAIEKFDYSRNLRFSTYATWWIRQRIQRAVVEQFRSVKIPVHYGDRVRKMYRVMRELEQLLGRKPNTLEIADHMGVNEKKVEDFLRRSQHVLSLDEELGEIDGDSFTLGEFIEDEDSPNPVAWAEERLLVERMKEILDRIPYREALILRLRYGIGKDRSYTLEEVGKKLGLTRERVRQVEQKAFVKLRKITGI